MSFLRHLFKMILVILVCNVSSWILIFKFIFPWLVNAEKKQSRHCGAYDGHGGEEPCHYSGYRGTYDTGLAYQLFIILNSVIVCLVGAIYLLYASDYDTEVGVVGCLKYPFIFCKNMFKGNFYV